MRIGQWIATALAGLCLLASMPLGRMREGKNDFVHFYIGGKLYGTPDIHSQDVNYKLQEELIGGRMDNSFFGRPTFYGFFLKPFAMLSYPAAYAVFQVLSLGAVIAFIFLQTKGLGALPYLAMVSVPLVTNFANGQDVVFLLLICAVSLLLADRGRDFAAGLLFSLCAIKLHLFVFVPVAIIIFRRWRFLAGGAAGGAVLAILSLAAGGIELQRRLLEEMRKPDHSPYGNWMPNLRSLSGDDSTLFVILALTVSVMVIWLIWKAPSLQAAFGWALIGGLLVSFHAYVQDCLMVLLAFTLVSSMIPTVTRALFYAAILPPIYIIHLCGPPYTALFPALLIALLGVQIYAEATARTRIAQPCLS